MLVCSRQFRNCQASLRICLKPAEQLQELHNWNEIYISRKCIFLVKHC